jgi:hypothetical protein
MPVWPDAHRPAVLMHDVRSAHCDERHTPIARAAVLGGQKAQCAAAIAEQPSKPSRAECPDLGSSARRNTPGVGGCDDYAKEAINPCASGLFGRATRSRARTRLLRREKVNSCRHTVIARSASDEAIQNAAAARFWIASAYALWATRRRRFARNDDPYAWRTLVDHALSGVLVYCIIRSIAYQ